MFQFPPIWGLPGSASPFCEKLEVYLRTYKIPYEMIHTVKPEESPIHKLPFVLFNNELLADSSIIIERLNKHFDINPDADYSPVLVSVGHSFQRLLEEHLYFCMGYFRFVDPEYWPATKQAFFGELPPVVRQLVPRFVQGPIKKKVCLNKELVDMVEMKSSRSPMMICELSLISLATKTFSWAKLFQPSTLHFLRLWMQL